MHPQFEPVDTEINALIFDAICRAAVAGIEAEELLLGPKELGALDRLLGDTGDLLPADESESRQVR